MAPFIIRQFPSTDLRVRMLTHHNKVVLLLRHITKVFMHNNALIPHFNIGFEFHSSHRPRRDVGACRSPEQHIRNLRVKISTRDTYGLKCFDVPYINPRNNSTRQLYFPDNAKMPMRTWCDASAAKRVPPCPTPPGT